MDKKEISREKFDDEWDEWRKKIWGSNLFNILDNDLYDLNTSRRGDAVSKLITAVNVYCFCCSDFDKIPEVDWSIKLRNDDRFSLEPAKVNKNSFAHWRQHGALLYPKVLDNQSQRELPQINSLLFSLVFLFRQFTDNSTDDNWFKTKFGPMPSTGNPNYKLVTKLINATNEFANPPFLSERLNHDQVKMRIKRLVDNDIQLSSWIAPRYLTWPDGTHFSKDNKIILD